MRGELERCSVGSGGQTLNLVGMGWSVKLCDHSMEQLNRIRLEVCYGGWC